MLMLTLCSPGRGDRVRDLVEYSCGRACSVLDRPTQSNRGCSGRRNTGWAASESGIGDGEYEKLLHCMYGVPCLHRNEIYALLKCSCSCIHSEYSLTACSKLVSGL